MKRTLYVLLFTVFTVAACFTAKAQPAATIHTITPDTFTLFDSLRNRPVPVACYTLDHKLNNKQRVVIISHGYGQNHSGSYLAYSYLATRLAAKGYFVASIQHELPSDSLIPSAGVPQVVRRPFWERGADNIWFVMQQLKKLYPGLDFNHIALIGHSNGGDMTALFPQKYPGKVAKIITLDNRRMPLPRTRHPRVYSLRSCDQPADEGVLPTAEEQKAFGIVIVKLPDTIHNDMGDNGKERQRAEIAAYVIGFLKR